MSLRHVTFPGNDFRTRGAPVYAGGRGDAIYSFRVPEAQDICEPAMKIHPTAIVDSGAHLGSDVIVGPGAIIESQATIGARTIIGPYAVIHRFVKMGEDNQIHAHAVIGNVPQDLAFKGGDSWVEIGSRNVLREGVTVNRSTKLGSATRLGSDCLLMAYVHVAHDCRIGNRVILANNIALGGYVEIGDAAVVGGGSVVHQFCRIGSLAMVAGFIAVRQDIMPYCLAAGTPVRHYRLNTIGLHRIGISGERYRTLEAAFRTLRAGRDLNGNDETPEVAYLKAWRRTPSRRGICRIFNSSGKPPEEQQSDA
jgi:UDP-N-acetylglucosamine acyltransferase